jgi:tripartite-type tricarboxylate transporter receptor subunit TctC
MRRVKKLCAEALVLTALMSPMAAMPAEPDSFYKGRMMSMVIGFGVGGGYDLFGRLLAAYMPKYIAGDPKIVPQNMVGAGSLRAANYLYTAAPKDGSVIGTFARSLPLAPLFEKADFDGRRFTWLGSITQDVTVCLAWHQSRIKTWNDFLNLPSSFGGEGPGAEPDIYALFFKNVFGAKLKLVSGYHGTNDAFLALERGEIDGLCGLSWGTLKGLHGAWIAEKKIKILVQAGLQKIPELGDTPAASDMVTTREQQQILDLLFSSLAMARPVAAPPDIPNERRAVLVSAFERTAKDPDFLKEAEKLQLDVDLVTASRIDDLLARAYAAPRDVIRKASDAISR